MFTERVWTTRFSKDSNGDPYNLAVYRNDVQSAYVRFMGGCINFIDPAPDMGYYTLFRERLYPDHTEANRQLADGILEVRDDGEDAEMWIGQAWCDLHERDEYQLHLDQVALRKKPVVSVRLCIASRTLVFTMHDSSEYTVDLWFKHAEHAQAYVEGVVNQFGEPEKSDTVWMWRSVSGHVVCETCMGVGVFPDKLVITAKGIETEGGGICAYCAGTGYYAPSERDPHANSPDMGRGIK